MVIPKSCKVLIVMMAAILIWAILPVTSTTFERDGVDALGEEITIVFDTAGGVAIDNDSVIVGEPYNLPTPSKMGYAFGGWQYNGSPVAISGTTWDILPDTGTEITLVASWSIQNYNILYTNIDDIIGENPNPNTYNINSNIEFQPVEKLGYTFDGWYNGLLGLVEKIEPNSRVGNITLEAAWSVVDYTITYEDLFTADNNNPTTYNVESAITLSKPIRLGYDFVGWYIISNEGVETLVTEIVAGTTGDLTLHAKWSLKRFTVSFSEGGYNSITQDFETTIAELPTPERDGYIFDGWYTDQTYRQQFTTDTALYQDYVLYAKWVKLTDPVWYWVLGALVIVTLGLAVWYIISYKNRQKHGCEF